MKYILLFISIIFSNLFLANCPEILNHEVRILDSEDTKNLCEYKNKVVLAVNVASKCGFTYQYESLQKLYKNFKEQDFVVLGFPSRDFMFQEYKDESKVKEFCSTKYVTFPMFATSSVKGKKANNFFQGLIKQTGVEPGWNFHKYLIDKEGGVISFDTKIEPDSAKLLESIQSIL